MLGEPRRAIEFYEQQLEIVQEIGDRGGESAALYNMAGELVNIGERGRAIELGERSLEIKLEIEDPWAKRVRAALEEWRRGE
jgi:tetratricopeptide (TPR) repeat protein